MSKNQRRLQIGHEFQAALAIAQRDLLKFLRDRTRILATLIFPFVFVAILGGSMQANLGKVAGYDFLLFTLTGVFAQTLFQSTASGIISLVEDRENDFSREIFISPISRYTIIFGKILGETLVSLCQGVVILLFGLIVGVHITSTFILALVPVTLVSCLLGGAFGIMVLGNLSSQRSANQIFPFVIFPQFFLSGSFNPIKELPWYLDWLAKIMPMRYAVDFGRNLFYQGNPEYDKVVIFPPWLNLSIIAVMFTLFLVVGTYMFVNKERNR